MSMIWQPGIYPNDSSRAQLRRVMTDPSGNAGWTLKDRLWHNDLMWAYYSNDVYQDWILELNDPRSMWNAYRSLYGLYRWIRSLVNPFKRVVEFYVNEVYPPPAMVSNGITEVDGIKLAFPLSGDTPQPLQRAIAQGMQWGNWLDNNALLVRYSAAVGNCLAEVVDDRERGKVYPRVYWPGHITDITLDQTGNVKMYEITMPAWDEQQQRMYTYKKRVDKQSIQAWYNADLIYRAPNGYGFVPAVWMRHFNTGDTFGQPVMWTALDLVDEMNNLLSMAHDRLEIFLTSDVFAKGNTDLGALDADAADADLPKPSVDRKDKQRIGIVEVDPDFNLEALPIDISQVQARVDFLYQQLMTDYRELAAYMMMAEKGAASGVAVEQILGDVEGVVLRAQDNYDQQQQKLWGMVVTIGGMCANSTAWAATRDALTPAQQKFLPFNLKSYAQGDVNFNIPNREFIPPSELERWTTRNTRATALAAEEALGVPRERTLHELDIPEKEIQQIIAEQQKAEAAAQRQRIAELQALRDAQFGPNGPGSTASDQQQLNDQSAQQQQTRMQQAMMGGTNGRNDGNASQP